MNKKSTPKKIYLLQFDINNSNSNSNNNNPQVSILIEKLGDYCIYKKNFLINTSLSKTKIINKFKKILTKEDQIFVKEIKENELDDFPFIINDWFYKNLQEQNSQNETNFIQDNYDLIKQDALNKINSLLDNVKDELDKQISSRKEV